MDLIKKLSAGACAVALTATVASAQTNLRIQTHFSQETLSGQLAKKYIERHSGNVQRRNRR